MSGKERCVNPRCTQYGEIQEGPCTFPDKYREVSYPAGRHGDRINMMICTDCGDFVFDQKVHTQFHARLYMAGVPNK